MAALGLLGLRALVTVGPNGDPAVVGTPPDGIRVERYVPQSALLPHCALVVSHGGSGTALGALAAGLPQLCLPQGADQFLNAGAIAAGGAGIALLPSEATADSIATAIERLLADHTFRDAAHRVSQDIASMPPVAEAAAALESLIGASAG